MPKRLIIAEKANMAEAIVKALSQGPVKHDASGAWLTGDDIVAACSGHILEQFMPDDYDPRYKQWTLEDLPIVPEVWKLKPMGTAGKNLKQIQWGLKQCEVVVHAGDLDQEGQLVIDEVLRYLGWQGPVQRVLLADLNPAPIRKAFQNLRDNQEPLFQGMSRRALSRSQGDWLLGLNASRLYTVLGRQVGIQQTLTAGRVQSALLGLVARRDIEIENFKPHDYWTVALKVAHPNGVFLAKWQPREGQDGLDEEGRLVKEAIIAGLQRLAPGKAVILDTQTERKKQRAPLPFSLSELQKVASSKLGLSMQATLDIAQKLYDHHQLISYPRTDTGYLPVDQHTHAPEVLEAVAQNLPDMAPLVSHADHTLKSPAFNDKKVGAHHAMVPTGSTNPQRVERLPRHERAIYELICQRFVAQFYPPAEFDATVIRVGAPDGEGERFVAKGKVWIKEGFRAVMHPGGTQAEDDDAGKDEDGAEQALPKVVQGDAVNAQSLETSKKQTTPPKPYTDATLVTAMTNIHRHVSNPENGRLLKEGDGIGTEATRASILEGLVNRQLLLREKKTIRTTPVGRMHYHLMPPDLTTPDIAALFEAATRQVGAGELELEAFRQKVVGFLRAQIDDRGRWLERAKQLVPQQAASGFQCRHCQGPLFKRSGKKRGTTTKVTFFSCPNPECGCMFGEKEGAPSLCFKGPLKDADEAAAAQEKAQRMATAPPCPECGNPVLRYKKRGADWFFWRCESTPTQENCNSVYRDAEGKPGEPFVVRGEKVVKPADGPACPECEQATRKAVTREKKTPILVCDQCDSMCWVEKDGSAGALFKKRGKMLKRKKGTGAKPKKTVTSNW